MAGSPLTGSGVKSLLCRYFTSTNIFLERLRLPSSHLSHILSALDRHSPCSSYIYQQPLARCRFEVKVIGHQTWSGFQFGRIFSWSLNLLHRPWISISFSVNCITAGGPFIIQKVVFLYFIFFPFKDRLGYSDSGRAYCFLRVVTLLCVYSITLGPGFWLLVFRLLVCNRWFLLWHVFPNLISTVRFLGLC